MDDLTVTGAETTECLLLRTWNVPLCWDRFTTNYYLPDGSYGSITTGIYHCASGGSANLFTGDYSLPNGQSGNLYGQDPSEQPHTSTLHLPTPYTSSGIGSAIPATEVGTDASFPTPNSTGSGYGQPQNTTIIGTGTSDGNFPIITNVIIPTASITPPINNTGTQKTAMYGQKLLVLLAVAVGGAARQF
ncbi:uncharacterized protein A1O9_03004 [Exophiala aquamarina CBS 119918]|uniref:Uncharacterized protein n=1 Tax=Exophiala aquamarina CBS 119918 TaxID=1182545 RepID=A0A072PQ22_9EURO|nr:uncharacterized protein A1O9_03004 [Exophiala aquamarina CBS 119918]KEF61438.1 hypothetical protein A1O9_03004 [Exophiala aquamarina CBS 119918]